MVKLRQLVFTHGRVSGKGGLEGGGGADKKTERGRSKTLKELTCRLDKPDIFLSSWVHEFHLLKKNHCENYDGGANYFVIGKGYSLAVWNATTA